MAKFKHTDKYLFMVLLMLIGLLVSCSLRRPPEATPEPAPASVSPVLATPAAQSPAAGICAEFDGENVTITINPDIPDPRCVSIRPDQKLMVVNHRGEPIQVRIGNFEVSLPNGGEQFFDLPFGQYLAPGVHQMLVTPCCGAELVLPVP
jgi:hypothetical protein